MERKELFSDSRLSLSLFYDLEMMMQSWASHFNDFVPHFTYYKRGVPIPAFRGGVETWMGSFGIIPFLLWRSSRNSDAGGDQKVPALLPVAAMSGQDGPHREVLRCPHFCLRAGAGQDPSAQAISLLKACCPIVTLFQHVFCCLNGHAFGHHILLEQCLCLHLRY